MLKLISLALVVFAMAGQASIFNGGDKTWYCGILAKEDCMTHQVHIRCGTDGATYRNMCALGQSHCNNPLVNEAHEGPCTVSHTTTPSPQQITHGSQVILDFQCITLSHRDCVNAYHEKICGTDGHTYSDFCEYEKSRCTHKNLHVAHLGDCSA